LAFRILQLASASEETKERIGNLCGSMADVSSCDLLGIQAAAAVVVVVQKLCRMKVSSSFCGYVGENARNMFTVVDGEMNHWVLVCIPMQQCY